MSNSITHNILAKYVYHIFQFQLLGLAVYNVCLFSALGSIVVFCLYDIGRYKEGYIVFALCIIQVTTVTLCFVFVPKVRNYTIHSSLIRRLSKICYYLGKGKVTESF